MNLPTGTEYVYLAAAPGTGHKYELECYDNKSKNRKLLGSIGTTLSALNKVNTGGGHKLRCNSKWRWARVNYSLTASGKILGFTLMVVPAPV